MSTPRSTCRLRYLWARLRQHSRRNDGVPLRICRSVWSSSIFFKPFGWSSVKARLTPKEETMAFTADEIRANRDYFVQKLHAEKQRNDVLHAVETGNFDFVLLDTRGKEPFASGHIPAALSDPIGEL